MSDKEARSDASSVIEKRFITGAGWFEERWRRSWKFRFWYVYFSVKEWLLYNLC
jgi:hypothetical protein